MNEKPQKKRKYRTPKLSEYGSVAKITAELSNSGADGGSGGFMRTKGAG